MRASDWEIKDFDEFARHATRLANGLVRAWEGEHYQETTRAEFYEAVEGTRDALRELLDRVDFDWLYCEDCAMPLDHKELKTGQQCDRCSAHNQIEAAEARADEAMLLYASMAQ